MKKSKHIKKNPGISLQRLEELKHATLIASTGASMRLAGSKLRRRSRVSDKRK
jgi:hypothetical protein